MSLTENMGAADIAAVVGNNRNNSGFFGGDGLYAIIVLFILMAMINGSWGGGFGGGGMMPWIGQTNTNNDVQRGFDHASVMGALGDITGAVNGINQSICSGFANAETAATARQMANMNQLFSLQSAFQQCCCENRAGLADLKYTVATENCADRQALSEGVRDIITNQTQNTQRILDQICNDKIDAKNEKILELQNALNMATLRESQTAQNSLIMQGFANETDALYNRLNNCPVGTVPVYGRQPIFTCNNNGCGCG